MFPLMKGRACARERATMVRNGLAIMIPLAFAFALLDLNGGVFWLGILEGFVALGMVAMYAGVERHGQWAEAAAHLVTLGLAAVFLGALASGGLVGLGGVWSCGFPFVATFLLGGRRGGWWTLGYGAAMAATLAASARGLPAGMMRYDADQALYLLVAYAAFGGLAWLQTRARECMERESLLLREAFDYTPIALFITDRNGRITYANRACGELHGVDPDRVVGEYAARMRGGRENDELFQSIVAAMEEGRHWTGEVPLRVGRTLVRRTVSPVYDGEERLTHHICVDEDITGERERQEAAERTQRLESLGMLAGGVAHDFNNMLAGIVGSAELLEMDDGLGEEHKSLARDILRIGDRAAEVCKQLLAYAGRRQYALDDLDINAMVRDMGELIETSAGHRARVLMELADDLPAVRANRGRIQQVVLNFVVNAAQAMEAGRRGEIALRTRVVEADRAMLDACLEGRGLPEGRYVSVCVRDNGVGMDEATLARIFDPFFTTKEDGTGLGLSAVLGIVRAHGGCVRVESAPGQGSAFEVLLPAKEGRAETAPEQRTLVKTRPFAGRAALVVDDDEHVRRVARRLLEGLGMTVTDAADGEEGVERFRKAKATLDVVLMDVSMPGMDGLEAMRRMREIHAGTPVVLMSGYSDQRLPPPGAGGPDAFVAKPFHAASLVEALSPLLGGGA